MFDLAGSVDGFLRAVRDIEGLEFLADLVGDGFEPDDDFYLEDNGARSGKRVPESLYMVMTNSRAIDELISLFDRWVADPGMDFPFGMAPLRDVFGGLRAIRRWSPEDRVRETGLLDQWEETLEVVGVSGVARVEVELWFRAGATDRANAEALVRELIERGRGVVQQSVVIEEIRYHALLADLPHHQVASVLDNGPEAIELLAADAVMFVTPSVPMSLESPEPTAVAADERGQRPQGPPRVALLDGLPLANHRLLDGRLIIDDPDDFATAYGASPRGHGTSMASLICHGDLSTDEPSLTAPLYVRPVLVPHHLNRNQEVTPGGQLLVDLIHRCFVRMFEGDGTNPPVAPSVRVINLSIGDPARVFARQLSPLARLLDWLTFRYNRLVVVSAGNHRSQVMASHEETTGDLTDARKAVALRLRDQAALRRMLSPAEAINVLTVGSVHADGAEPNLPSNIVDLIEPGAPAPYTPAGTGYHRAVKPDLLLPGGRQVYVRPPDGTALTMLDAASAQVTGPGLLSAGSGAPGALDGVAYTAGTSNSAALASRYLDQILELLAVPVDPGLPAMPDAQYHPVVARAMLVHAAQWGEAGEMLRRQLGISGQDARKELVQLLGYGPVRPDQILAGDRVRAVLVGADSIGKDERRTFRFPLPPSLAATTLWRRLTLTLAWLSPLNPRSQKYRMARLQVTPPTDEIGTARVEAPHFAVRKGTVHHEVLEGEAAVAFQAGTSLEIGVDCFVDAGKLESPVRFGLIVSLELEEGVLIDVHNEVQQQLQVQIRQMVRAKATPGS
ncbi:MAG: S8 family peptidase [Aquihabitans sp.]